MVGPGGVGKTALAVMWANRHTERFPDGQLYVDLRGFSPDTTVAPVDALGRFLRALGVEPRHVPATVAEQVTLYRTITAGRQLLMLVVLDNAASAEQVRPLIPTSTRSVVVVTSRLRLDGLFADGAQLVQVPPLPEAAAVALLEELIGERAADEPDATAELAQLCGLFPIALRVAAARLVTRPTWSVSEVVARLRDERSRLAALSRLSAPEDSVTALFDWSYRNLQSYAADLYRCLGSLPAPEFGIDVAAAVSGLAEHEVAVALQVLVDASLLEEVALDRYRFHDLVRLHARAQPAPDRDRLEVVPRAAAWYLREMTRANLVVIPVRWRVSPVADELAGEPVRFDSDAAALDWLHRELPNVLAVLEEAVADRHDELAWQLCEALWELMLYRKPFPEWLRSHQLGITAAQRCRNKVAESRLRYQRGRAYLDLGQLPQAETEVRHALELARHAEDRRTESAALDLLGRVAQARGDVDTAIKHFTASMHIEADLGIDRGVASRHSRIGDALLQAGRELEAEPHLQTALEMLTAIGDDKDVARVALGLARIDALAGRQDAAIERLQMARRVLGRTGSAVYEASVLLALAEVAAHDSNPDQARAYLTEAIELLHDLGGAALDKAQKALAALDHGSRAPQQASAHNGTSGDGGI
ncbi:ATP-binding protein [Amycolatopsis tolypomycina]|uniref:ATP-binding protein n=1 Tax=Amycolatopsis tolypomycina TaxID=208445 RepID=UPI001FC96B9A|nr:tetratricopeptide repeat protein [Amycolatopsis tolypomycina]